MQVRYHFFSPFKPLTFPTTATQVNKLRQINELLHLVDQVRSTTGGRYTNEIFQEARRRNEASPELPPGERHENTSRWVYDALWSKLGGSCFPSSASLTLSTGMLLGCGTMDIAKW